MKRIDRIRNLPIRAFAAKLLQYLPDYDCWLSSDGKTFSDFTKALDYQENWLNCDESTESGYITEGDTVLADNTICVVISVGSDDNGVDWYEVEPIEFKGISREFTIDKLIKI